MSGLIDASLAASGLPVFSAATCLLLCSSYRLIHIAICRLYTPMTWPAALMPLEADQRYLSLPVSCCGGRHRGKSGAKCPRVVLQANEVAPAVSVCKAIEFAASTKKVGSHEKLIFKMEDTSTRLIRLYEHRPRFHVTNWKRKI